MAGGNALREIVALEDLGDRDRPRQLDDVGERQAGQPLAVVPHLRTIRIEDEQRLVEIEPCAGVDLLIGQNRALGGPAGGITNPRRVIADDENADVARVLERPHALERDPSADVDVGRGDVDPELHPQRPPERELLLEAALREQVDVIAGEGVDVAHGADSTGAGARPDARWRKAASPASPAAAETPPAITSVPRAPSAATSAPPAARATSSAELRRPL